MRCRWITPALVSGLLSLLTTGGLLLAGGELRANVPENMNCIVLCQQAPAAERNICIAACEQVLHGANAQTQNASARPQAMQGTFGAAPQQSPSGTPVSSAAQSSAPALVSSAAAIPFLPQLPQFPTLPQLPTLPPLPVLPIPPQQALPPAAAAPRSATSSASQAVQSPSPSQLPTTPTEPLSPPSAPLPLTQPSFAPPIAAPPPAQGECIAISFRREGSGFCILADRCIADTLLRRGFRADPSCLGAVDFSHLYHSTAFRGAQHVPLWGERARPDVLDIVQRTMIALDEVTPRVVPGSPAATAVHELHSYLTIVRMNAAARDLTSLETDATVQYLRLRLLDTISALRTANVPLIPGVATATQSGGGIQEDLSTILYTLLPRLFDRLAIAHVLGLDVTAARSTHGEAANAFETVKQSCRENQMDAGCRTALQTVIRTLQGLEQILKAPLEASGMLTAIEQELRINATHGAAMDQGFPRPYLE